MGGGLGSSGLAGSALTATHIAAASAGLIWSLIEWVHKGKPTALGFATGLVAGLVGITPASGFVRPLAAVVIGAATSVVCYLALWAKPRLKYDDSLDAFGVHGIGGALGALLVGIFAFRPVTGGGGQFVKQLVGVGVAAIFAFVVSYVIAIVLHKTVGLRVKEEDEFNGLDLALHGEAGYHLSEDSLSMATVGHEGIPDARGTHDVAAAR